MSRNTHNTIRNVLEALTMLVGLAVVLTPGSVHAGGAVSNPALLYQQFFGKEGLYLAKADGMETQLLVRDKSQTRIEGARWSPDGGKIAYAVFPHDTNAWADLYTISPDGSTRTLVRSFDGLPMPTDGMAWSPDARTIVFMSWGAGSRLDEVDVTTGNTRLLFDFLNLDDPIRVALPDFSPDLDPASGYQGYLAFRASDIYAVNGVTLGRDIVLLDMTLPATSNAALTTSGQIHIFRIAEHQSHPAWSPDGRFITYTGGGKLGAIGVDIQVADPNDRSQDVITQSGHWVLQSADAAPDKTAWSPDGRYLGFSRYVGGEGFADYDLFRARFAVNASDTPVLSDLTNLSPNTSGTREIARDWNPLWQDDLGGEEPPTSPGITIEPVSGLVTTEAGGTDTFTIVLDSQPAETVTIGLSSDDTTEGTVSPVSVTFDGTNWDTPQTVTVTGQDDLDQDGDVTYSILTAAAVSDDPDYSGLDAADVAVVNLDDEASPEPTEVFVTFIEYATEGGKSADKHLLITVALADENGAPVAGASVSIHISLDGQSYDSQTDSTGEDGTATFRLSNAPSGTYTTEVTAVVAEGLLWDGVTPPNEFTK